jgi:uncharacterized protein (UPF0262 family)
MTDKPDGRLIAIEFDSRMATAPTPDADHERRVAIYDILEENSFSLVGHGGGPYRLTLANEAGRLVFDIAGEDEARITMIGLAMSPLRRIVKDYFMICDTYHRAIRQATPSQIETIDMARRSLHDEGAGLLTERLKGKVEFDPKTARRLFTLISVLFWRG